MDYQQIYKTWGDLNDCRLRIALHGDGGESLWGKKLPGGLVGINNSPLHEEYRYQDIVKPFGSAPTLIHRRWKEKLPFTYEPIEDEEKNRELRGRIWDAADGHGGHLSFWVDGVAVVLAETPEQLGTIVKSLEAMDISFEVQAEESDE